MKILILLRNINFGGGTPNLIRNLLIEIQRNHYDGIKLDLWIYDNIEDVNRLKKIFLNTKVFYQKNTFSIYNKVKNTNSFVKEERYNYIIATCFRTYIIARLIYPKYKTIFWFHGSEIVSKGYRKILFKILGNKFSIANSYYTARNNKLKNYRVLYNGASKIFLKQSSDDFYEKFNIPKNSLILINIGGWNKLKNHITLLKAFDLLVEEIPNLYLICIGELSKLTEEISKSIKNKKNLRIEDKIPFAARYIQKCDLYVHTCYKEAFGLAVVEAMISGVPIIAPNSGAFPEIIDNYQNGVLYNEPFSYLNLKKEIKNLLDNKNLRELLAKNGKIYADKNFDINFFVKNFINILNEKKRFYL